MPTTLGRLADALAARSAALDQEWREAVRAAGRGDDLGVEVVLGLCGRAGKTPAEFTADAETFAHRLALRERADEAEGANARVAELNARLADIDRRFASMKRQHEIGRAGLQHEIDATVFELSIAKQAERELRDTCPYPDLHDRRRQIDGDLAAVEQEARTARRSKEDAAGLLSAAEAKLRSADRETRPAREQAVADARGRLDRAAAALSEAEDRRASLLANRDQLDLEMAGP